jgi:hypothetical protein
MSYHTLSTNSTETQSDVQQVVQVVFHSAELRKSTLLIALNRNPP